MSTKYDYVGLEHEFVSSMPPLSIRELARKHDIPDSKVSSLHAMARKKDADGRSWYDKQDQFAVATTDQAITLNAAREARRRLRESTVVDHAIDLIDDALLSARESIRETVDIHDDDGKIIRTERKYRVQIRDVTALIDRLGAVFGRSENAPIGESPIRGNVNANVNVPADSPVGMALLERLADVAGSQPRPAQPRRVGPTSLPDAPDPS